MSDSEDRAASSTGNSKPAPADGSPPAEQSAAVEARLRAYWRANLRLMGVLLAVWFVVSYGCGILFADALNSIRIGGFKLGFWFAQQGAIYVFLLLIVVYVAAMNRIDRQFGVSEEDDDADGGAR